MSVETYFFKAFARAGRPGFCDDEEYISDSFQTLEKCFNYVASFKPSEFFNDLRCFNGIVVYKTINNQMVEQLQTRDIFNYI